MKTDLLLKLADLLDTVPEDQFNYESWFHCKNSTDESPRAGGCGTTACALGWATTMPETGLSLVVRGRYETSFVVHAKTRDDIDPDNPNGESLLAACRAFDITREEARLLFLPNFDGPGSDASAKEVADWIRTVVARKTAKKEKTT